MKSINIENKYLLGILNGFIDEFMQIERGEKLMLGSKKHTAEYACSTEYLEVMQNKKVDGFPETTWGTDLHLNLADLISRRRVTQEFGRVVEDMDRELLSWTGSRFNAVKMYYPKTGYMGWHHNANCPGYNILLSWSKDGTGYFRYQDPITKEIVTMNDTPGWTCKVGYYGAWHETDRIYWHCANAEHEERLTLGYVIPHEGMWEDMVDDIQTK